jgi:hypothetical protein
MAIEESDMESTCGPLVALETGGLLLLQDKAFPNVVTIVTGESLHVSWWAHPLGHVVFRCANEIAAHPDVLVSKLLDGKVTFVHRRLWPALLAIAIAREPWQTTGLSREGQALLDQVESAESIVASGPASKEIEGRLLVLGDQIHTESGRHQIRLETWKSWAVRTCCKPSRSAAQGKARLEKAVTGLGGAVESLPWHRFAVKSTGRRKIKDGLSSNP